MPVVTKLHSNLDHHPDTNGNQAGSSNLGHDLLQVGDIVGGANQSSSTSKEGVGTSGIHDGVLLALLDSGARKADIIGVLLDRQRLSSQSCLVDLQSKMLCCICRTSYRKKPSRLSVQFSGEDTYSQDKLSLTNALAEEELRRTTPCSTHVV